jgi:hypothetical protein
MFQKFRKCSFPFNLTRAIYRLVYELLYLNVKIFGQFLSIRDSYQNGPKILTSKYDNSYTNRQIALVLCDERRPMTLYHRSLKTL